MNDTSIQPPVPAPGPDEPPAAHASAQPTGLRHRVLGMRAVAAVALAALVLGGLGGVALGAVSNGADDQQQGPGGRGGFGGPGGGQNLQPGQGFPGQQQDGGLQPGQAPLPGGGLPPGTAPQDDVQPDAPATESSGTNA